MTENKIRTLREADRGQKTTTFVTHGQQNIGKGWWLRTIARLLLGLVVLVGVAGCSWTDKGGTHYLIVGVGFGIITTTNRVGVEVRDSQILGGEFGPDTLGLGWLENHRTTIDPAIASNVVISVKACGMNVTIKNFDPSETNQNDSNESNSKQTK